MQWQNPADLEPWKDCVQQREREALAALKISKFGPKNRLKLALQEARATVALREGRPGLQAEKMRRSRAALAASSVDLKRRCGRCKTCVGQFFGQRRYDCLTQRLKAAALSGHAGAQIAACGSGAIGAKIGVWWTGDQKFYEGQVCYFDPMTTEHVVAYDDGEIGMHRLWQHDERIRLLNAPNEWSQHANEARMKMKEATEGPLMHPDIIRKVTEAIMVAETTTAVLETATQGIDSVLHEHVILQESRMDTVGNGIAAVDAVTNGPAHVDTPGAALNPLPLRMPSSVPHADHDIEYVTNPTIPRACALPSQRGRGRPRGSRQRVSGPKSQKMKKQR